MLPYWKLLNSHLALILPCIRNEKRRGGSNKKNADIDQRGMAAVTVAGFSIIRMTS